MSRLIIAALVISNMALATTQFEFVYPEPRGKLDDFFERVAGRAMLLMFKDPNVLRCINSHKNRIELKDEKEFLNPRVLSGMEGIDNPPNKLYLERPILFFMQRKVMNGKIEDPVSWLPSVHIHYEYEPNNSAFAWAPIGGITTVEGRKANYSVGEFDFTINIAKLSVTKDLDDWAGIVAHEMLHNLMHIHPDPKKVGAQKAYHPSYMINLVQNCVSSVGRAYSNYAIRYRCGGRSPR